MEAPNMMNEIVDFTIKYIMTIIMLIITLFTLVNLYDLLFNNRLSNEQFRRLKVRIIYWLLFTGLLWFLWLKVFKFLP